jgi:hypothetical protein
MYKKYQSEDLEEKFYTFWTVTHDRANHQLPHFGKAMLDITTVLEFNPRNNYVSKYLKLMYALLGGKESYENIVAKKAYDMDEYVGRPVIGYIEEGKNPDRDGLWVSRVKDIEPVDDGMRAAILPMWKEAKIEKSPTSGMSYLTYPTPATQDEADAQVKPITESDPLLDPLTDGGIPF